MINTENNYENILKTYLTEMKVVFDDNAIQKILALIEEIYNFNATTNIIGSKEKEDIFYRHIPDCLSIFNLKNEFSQEVLTGKKILDLGTGAGLPGLLFSILLEKSEIVPVSYTHLRAHETKANIVCRLLLEKKKKNTNNT